MPARLMRPVHHCLTLAVLTVLRGIATSEEVCGLGTQADPCCQREDGEEGGDDLEAVEFSLLQTSWALKRDTALDRTSEEFQRDASKPVERRPVLLFADPAGYIKQKASQLRESALVSVLLKDPDEPSSTTSSDHGFSGRLLLFVAIAALIVVAVFVILLIHSVWKWMMEKAGQKGVEEIEADDEEAGLMQMGLDSLVNQIGIALKVFSCISIALGAYMFLLPVDASEMITRICLVASGFFLLLNVDLVVETIRLGAEVKILEANTSSLEKKLKIQSKEVKRLDLAAQDMKMLNDKFGGSLEQAMEEQKELKASAREQIKMNLVQLIRLYVDSDMNRLLGRAELGKCAEIIAHLLGCVQPEIDIKHAEQLKSSIQRNYYFRQDQGVAIKTVADIYADIIMTDEKDNIPVLVRDAFKRAAEKKASDDW